MYINVLISLIKDQYVLFVNVCQLRLPLRQKQRLCLNYCQLMSYKLFNIPYYICQQCKSNPCKNGATCSKNGNHYSCACSGYYEGTNCEGDYEI